MSDENNRPESLNLKPIISHGVIKIQASQDNKRKSDVVQEAKQILKTNQQDKNK